MASYSPFANRYCVFVSNVVLIADDKGDKAKYGKGYIDNSVTENK